MKKINGVMCLILVLGASLLCAAQDSVELLQKAITRSRLTAVGAPPFHFLAHIDEQTNPDNKEYRAQIEVGWASADKWRIDLTSPEFARTVIVNGGRRYESNKGEYMPWWLRDLLTTEIENFELIENTSKVESWRYNDHFEQSGTAEVRVDHELGKIYVQLGRSKGAPPALPQMLQSMHLDADYDNYADFHDRPIARRIKLWLEPGTVLELIVDKLEDLYPPDPEGVIEQNSDPRESVERLFAIDKETPGTERLAFSVIDDQALLQRAINPPPMQWPRLHGGKVKGVVSLFVSIDKNGRVREAWGRNSDHPEPALAARKQIMQWRFPPMMIDGSPTQVEGVVSFAYDTTMADPYDHLTDKQARELASRIVAANFASGAPSGVKLTVHLFVSAEGFFAQIEGKVEVENWRSAGESNSIPRMILIGAAVEAVKQWRFHPYTPHGKPEPFIADIVFVTP